MYDKIDRQAKRAKISVYVCVCVFVCTYVQQIVSQAKRAKDIGLYIYGKSA
jgi:hypothetical protein